MERNTGRSRYAAGDGWGLHHSSAGQPAAAEEDTQLGVQPAAEAARTLEGSQGRLTLRVIRLHPPTTHVLFLEEETGRTYWVEVQDY